MTTSVDTPNATYSAAQPAWDEATALMGGYKAMRAAGEKYLPKNERESNKKYKARLNRSWLYGVFRTTVDSMAGKPFERPMQIDTDDTEYTDFMDDVDREGTDINAFAKNLLRAVLTKGISYILVDSPSIAAGENLSKAEQKEQGLRPYWCHIHAENLIAWDFDVVYGARTFTRLRIRESVEEPDGEFGTKTVAQVRVIDKDKWTTWRKSTAADKANQGWAIHEKGLRSVGEITLVPVYARASAFMQSESPLRPLAEKNIEHWQSASDQKNILHVARVPLLMLKGIDLPKDDEGNPTGDILTGGVLITDAEKGDAKWIELSGDGSIVQGQKDVERLVDEMESLGAQLMFRKAETPKTATEEQSKNKKGDSVLHAVIGNLENALDRALGFTALYRNDKVMPPSVSIYRDFSTFDPAGLSAKDLHEMYKDRQISHEVFIEQLKMLGLKTHLSAADIRDQIADETSSEI